MVDMANLTVSRGKHVRLPENSGNNMVPAFESFCERGSLLGLLVHRPFDYQLGDFPGYLVREC